MERSVNKDAILQKNVTSYGRQNNRGTYITRLSTEIMIAET